MKMNGWMKGFMGLLVVFMVAQPMLARQNAPRGSGRTRGEVVLEGWDVYGDTYIDLEDYRGKVVLVNFWATWCGYCTMEIPDLIDLQEDYEDELVIIGLSYDYYESTVIDYMEEEGMNYLNMMGDYSMDAAFGGISGYPTTFIISPEGLIVDTHVGYGTYSQFESMIEPYLD